MSAPSQVIPGLWLGGIQALLPQNLSACSITHVVSVVNGPPPQLPAGAAAGGHLCIDLEDVEGANLLEHLPRAVKFVEAALSDSGSCVLVHCAQGVSRSAAVVTAYLMTSGGLGAEQALEQLRSACPAASPNEGFLSQLELYGTMGCRLDASHLAFRRFQLARRREQWAETGTVDVAELALPSADLARADAAAGGTDAMVYRCRKCRCLVATSANVVERESASQAAEAAAAFPPWRRGGAGGRGPLLPELAGGGADLAVGGSVFVEPLRWMEGIVDSGEVQGKLYCPRCASRLGGFHWAGRQSSGGAWVAPAFQLHLGRMDAVTAAPAAAAGTIRAPRVLAAVPAASPTPAAAAGLSSQALGDEPSASDHATEPDTAASQLASLGLRDVVEASWRPFFTHLILDCDGVMVDSERASCEALRRAILQITGFDIPHSFPDDFEPVFGMDVESCVRFYQGRHAREDWGDASELAGRVSEAKEGIYRRLTSGGIAAFEGVAALVQQARSLGMGVAVASSGSPEKIAHNLASSGLTGLVEQHLVVSAKYVAAGKPSPDVYLEALRRLGCTDASRALVVEDAVNGLLAAAAAGCYAVGVTNSLCAALLVPHARLVVDSLLDIDLAAPPSGLQVEVE